VTGLLVQSVVRSEDCLFQRRLRGWPVGTSICDFIGAMYATASENIISLVRIR